MLLIGLVGEKGSGKDTFSQYLTEISGKKITHIRFSDLLKQTLKLWNLEVTRANLQKLAQFMEKGFGEGTLAGAISSQLKNIDSDIVIMDGMRWHPDIELLRSFPNNKLLYITAAPKLRFERLKMRGEKVGESEMSYDQFLEEEKAPNELLIPKIGAKADLKIENNGSIDEFNAKIKKLCEPLILV